MANVSRLPEYPLVVSLVSHERPGDYPTRIELRQVSIELKGWTRLDVAENAEKLEAYSRKHAILVAPQREASQWIGFRNVETQQLERMRRDGFEPAWLVKVGERFDVLLRAPSPLTQDESRQLKNHLTAVYQLTLPREALRDAIRLPGFVAELGKPGTRAELVEARDRAFSAGERVLTQLRNRVEQVHVARWARAQPLSPRAEKQSVTTLAGLGREAPRLPATHPVAKLEALLAAKADPFPQMRPYPGDTFRELADRALRYNNEALQPLLERRSVDLGNSPAVSRLCSVEHDLAACRFALTGQAQAVESGVSFHRQEIVAAAREFKGSPSWEAFEKYPMAVFDAFESQLRLYKINSDLHWVSSAQAALATDRLAAAVAMSPRDERVLEAFRVAAENLAREQFRSGKFGARPELVDTPLPQLKEELPALRAKEVSMVADIKTSGVSATGEISKKVEAWRNVIVEQTHLERALRFAEIGERIATSRFADRVSTVTEPDFARTFLARYCQQLGDWNAALPAPNPNTNTFARFEAVVDRVVNGDLSPRALAWLQGELVHQVGKRNLPSVPPQIARGDALDQLRLFVKLGQEVRSLAQELRQGPDWFDGGATILLEKSAQLVAVQQAVEKIERRHHGVAEPSPAPDGIAQATWDRAWLKRAEEKGLPQPERHLGNIGPPLAPRELAMERAVALKAVEVQAVRAVTRELERGAVLR